MSTITKNYCDKCGKEIELGKSNKITISIKMVS